MYDRYEVLWKSDFRYANINLRKYSVILLKKPVFIIIVVLHF
jgi:hypothetical protein